jgi:uncharacterized membrane-anchored protein
MKLIHAPRVNARYWTAITLASVFGTNMGDFYAHESGLGIVKGLLVLALLTAAVFVVERFDNISHEAYYWLVIIIIRTGATNIADYMMYRMKVPEPWLTLGWAAVIVIFGWFTHVALSRGDKSAGALPSTNAAYWLAMLGCGVFGTILGDTCEGVPRDILGHNAIRKDTSEGIAAIVLFVVLLAVLMAVKNVATRFIALYWLTVAICRTTGTAIGDWLADEKIVEIGLSYATLITGIAFVAVLVFWRGGSKAAPVGVAAGQEQA